ncbi:glycoside hydrolase family 12 protein [Diplodia corticola]|uniref:Glycoside hydrolase family 12 protein n=1 Tax=Diplodia corticola TaxID=236234 RepID=A0A1J9S541_9PEZI|nr:glycoside hydrolase family 12 protein [Diplodia corticola]OJD35639.1 glycoside hydrolase family 12 protein [Diplodia corticola]
MPRPYLVPGLTCVLSILSHMPAAQADYTYSGNLVTYCGQYDAINTTSGLYDIINNAWGDDGSGLTCTTVGEALLKRRDSSTNRLINTQTCLGESTDDFAVFNSTWRWSDAPTEVHSYPDALFNTELFPLAFPDVTSLKLKADWAIVPSPSDDTATDEATLASLDVVADVAIDLFLDEDASTASDSSAAAYEVMIWQAAYGNCDPIGYDPTSTSAPTQELDGVTYTLYQGPNANGQTVFTWYPDGNLTTIDVDYFPLLETLRGGGYIPTAAYLGRFQWGSETKHSAQDQNITFVVNSVTMSVN